MGLITGLMAAGERTGASITPPPPTTAFGALINHITGGADAKTFQPMNVNFGLFPPLEQRTKKKERKPAMSKRALEALEAWKAEL
jgi:methylenetetrahydrofolate--tRNA-(uracil-5-)-methyltransferase